MLKEIHIADELLRNEFGLLLDHLPAHLASRVRFVPASQLPAEATLESLWRRLRIDKDAAVFFHASSVDVARRQASRRGRVAALRDVLD